MITSCELCAKIAVEEAIREEQKRMEAIRKEAEGREVAKIFAENLIAPIISNLTKIPKELFIGYSEQTVDLFLSNGPGNKWELDGVTSRGYKKFCKKLTRDIVTENPFKTCLNYQYLNDYLLNFGYVITTKTKRFDNTYRYESRPNSEYGIGYTALYLSAICPEENF